MNREPIYRLQSLPYNTGPGLRTPSTRQFQNFKSQLQPDDSPSWGPPSDKFGPEASPWNPLYIFDGNKKYSIL